MELGNLDIMSTKFLSYLRYKCRSLEEDIVNRIRHMESVEVSFVLCRV